MRCHHRTPIIDVSEFAIDVTDETGKIIRTLTLDEIKKLPAHEVMFCLRCSSHRKKEMIECCEEGHHMKGINFGLFSISN